MKNVYMTVLLCATGLVTMSDALAATATVEQWSQSVTSYPERRPGFAFKLHPDTMDCDSFTEEKLDRATDNDGDIERHEFYTENLVYSSDDKKREEFFACNWWDWGHEVPFSGESVTSCPDGMEVAIAGAGRTIDYHDGTYTRYNYIWYCDADKPMGGWDEWEDRAQIDDCKNDPYLNFKGKSNVVAYLFDASIERNTLYRAIVNPSEHVCVTYACAPDHVPTLNIEEARITSANSDQLECIDGVKACKIYEENGTRKEYPKLRKTESCNSKKYWIGPTTDMSLQDATHGTLYIDTLTKRMNNQLKNSDQVKQLYALNPKNGVFTCNDLGCELTNDVLQADQTNCDYLCTDNGFAVRLTNDRDDNPCPTYFKYEYDETEKMYVCNFDAEAVSGKIADAANAADQQRARCAQLFCTASGGVYNSGGDYKYGNCTCKSTQCNGEYKNGDDTYNYCYKQKIKGVFKRCDNNTWSTSNMNDLDKDREGWISALETCMSDAPASSGASSINAATDDISKLAGRLAAIEGQFGLSKWRTAEGKFNTARLASDLTAGVVLGTTGALVTSSVVKKKQVKDGFESLECTVGGQHVGDWGDVFRIDGK